MDKRTVRITSAVVSALLAAWMSTFCAAQSPQIAMVPGTIATVAGSGSAGDTSSGTPITDKIDLPLCLRLDSAGNIYFSESSSYIREVNVANSNIVTLVGTGTAGFSGEGASASTAEINVARGIALDSFGNLYISDSGNNRIRVVYAGGSAAATLIETENPSVTAPTVGNIYTIAGTGGTTGGATGTLATSQVLSSPRGLFVDSFGNVFEAENGTNHIRVIYSGGSSVAALITLENPTATNPAVGSMYILAGTGAVAASGDGGLAISAALNPAALILDPAGDIYVAEQSNARVRKISASTGVITTVAGNGTAGYLGDGGPATSAELNTTRGIWIDAAGDLFIADTTNYVIRKVDVTGTISTVAGTAATVGAFSGDNGNATAARFSQPYDVTTDSSGNLYIADEANNRIRKVTSSTGSMAFGNVGIGGTSAGLIATVANAGSAQLNLSGINIGSGFSQVSSGGTDCTSASTVAPGLSCTLKIVFTPSSSGAATGTVLVTSSNSGNLTIALSGTGVVGSTTTALQASASPITPGQSVTLTATVTSTAGTPPGSVQFLDGTNVLSTQSLTAGVATFATPALAAGSNSLTAKYIATTGFTASTSQAQIVLVQSNGAVTSTLLSVNPIPAVYGQPVTLSASVQSTAQPTGTISFSNNGVLVGTASLSSGTAQLITSSLPVGIDSLVASYGGDANNNPSTSTPAMMETVGTLQAGWVPGVITTVAGIGVASDSGNGGAATLAGVNTPFSVRSDGAGNLYITGSGSTVREVVASTGIINIVAGTGTAAFSGDGGPAVSAAISVARGLGIDSQNDLYISDNGNNRIRVVYSGGAIAAALIATENPSVTAPVVGDIYTIAGNGSTSGGASGSLATAQGLSAPRGVWIDGLGNIYIAENGAGHIRVIYMAGTPLANLITLENPTVLTPNVGGMYILAGTGGTTSSGDGGLATSASFNPSEVSLDAAGNLYIAEQANCRIRKVVAATGLISTIAGNGTCAYTGDGGPATAAEINQVRGLWVDGGGNVYLADTTNNVVRKIDGSGTISTVAGSGATVGDGNAATNASLSAPYSVTLDNSGNLIIASATQYRIRSVSAANATLSFSTTPGNTSAVQTIALANTGGLPVLPGAITLTAGFVQLTGNSTDCTTGVAIAPGLSCTLRLTFTSSQSGAVSGTVTVATNAGNTPQGIFTAQLNGLSAYPNTVAAAISLATNLAAIDVGQSVTFTATVTSATSGTTVIPTGSVTFMAGTTSLGSATLSATGIATLATSQLPAGSISVTASYNGDTTYQPAFSSAIAVTVYTGPGDFTLGGTSTSSTVTAGHAGIFILSLASLAGFNQTVTLSCSNLPANAACMFEPAQFAPAIGATVTYGLTITTGQTTTSDNVRPASPGAAETIAAAMLLLLPLSWIRARKPLRRSGLTILVFGISLIASVLFSGCGSGNTALPATPPGTYSITVNATTGSINHTSTVTLIVQ